MAFGRAGDIKIASGDLNRNVWGATRGGQSCENCAFCDTRKRTCSDAPMESSNTKHDLWIVFRVGDEKYCKGQTKGAEISAKSI